MALEAPGAAGPASPVPLVQHPRPTSPLPVILTGEAFCPKGIFDAANYRMSIIGQK